MLLLRFRTILTIISLCKIRTLDRTTRLGTLDSGQVENLKNAMKTQATLFLSLKRSHTSGLIADTNRQHLSPAKE